MSAKADTRSALSRFWRAAKKDPAVRVFLGAAKGALSGAGVYIILFLVTFVLDAFSASMPIHDAGPLLFWRNFMEWAHVIGAAGSTVIVTLFEWRELWLRRENVDSAEGGSDAA